MRGATPRLVLIGFRGQSGLVVFPRLIFFIQIILFIFVQPLPEGRQLAIFRDEISPHSKQNKYAINLYRMLSKRSYPFRFLR